MNEPVDLHAVLKTFDDLWSPRIAARLNDYDVRVTKVAGSYIWHLHETTDELFLVLDGELGIALRDPDERTVTLSPGSVFVVPRGVEHRPFSDGGASIVVIEPAGIPTTGDRHEPIPDHIRTHTGIPLTKNP
ncbi:cupin domain-containing protein [Kribbella italica]|uniref:Mannose-6-phosphate isomerase-like protein (Cupin superfamily) n=1 Tax=Kribbella italica TaxID=1540520 RepID=A0A7W9J2F1_9ACTN|nr:cupin domain-containing protein [Kribbella italica]MBB5834412.1 mannose-6-phosphate isomerase-like protein (cupin superfamily) [Kribbella italica]